MVLDLKILVVGDLILLEKVKKKSGEMLFCSAVNNLRTEIGVSDDVLFI